ncbi:MAG TPA: DUF5011 domain-containing protein [Chitinophagaceae bacterium]|nr:DUF5011 domain-containing protein [Chitinophagaceae bacterium]
MNKIKISLLAMAALFAVACHKKTKNVSMTVTASYPVITINGSQFMSIPVGGSFTDAGATAVDTVLNETLSPISVTNDIDPTTPGFYTVQYTFKNSNGYVNTAARFVLVTNISDTLDYSGVYRRTSNNAPMNVAKVAAGLYSTDNVGGVALPSSFAIKAYFGQIDDTTLVVPLQPTTAGDMYCVNSFIYADVTADTTITWAVRNASFGTQQRTFIHE